MLFKMVLGLLPISLTKSVCEDCVFGRHHKEMFDNGKAWHTKEPLQLIHTYICGPLETHSIVSCGLFIYFYY